MMVPSLSSIIVPAAAGARLVSFVQLPAFGMLELGKATTPPPAGEGAWANAVVVQPANNMAVIAKETVECLAFTESSSCVFVHTDHASQTGNNVPSSDEGLGFLIPCILDFRFDLPDGQPYTPKALPSEAIDFVAALGDHQPDSH
jgi:hypothetical protein